MRIKAIMEPAPHLSGVYFDDYKVTYTPTNIVQYNEYYPYGLQTATSWTRENATQNNFLGNGGTELNSTTSLYDLEYRNYDPALARMHQVDPMADKYASYTPYNYSFNAPSKFNDPSGADPDYVCRRNVNNPGDYVSNNSNFGSSVFRSLSNFFSGQWSPNSNSLSGNSSNNGGDFWDMFSSVFASGAEGEVYGQNKDGKHGFWLETSFTGALDLQTRFRETVVLARFMEWNSGDRNANDNSFSWDKFNFHIGAEAGATYGPINFDVTLKNGAGVTWREEAEVLGEVTADTYYAPKRTNYPNSKKLVSEYGFFALGGASYESSVELVNGIPIDQSSKLNFGAYCFGIQINWDKLGLKDVRFGLDSGFGWSTFYGGKINLQIGGMYVNRPK